MASSSSPSWTRLARLPWLPRLAVIALALTAATASAEKNLPSTWKFCKRADPNLNKCLLIAVNEALHDIATSGLSDFDIPSIDPYKVSQMKMEQGSGPVSVHLDLRNVIIKGFRSFQFKDTRFTVSNLTLKAALEIIPELNLSGDYKINGRILVLPITGQGKCYWKMEKVRIHITMIGKEIVKNGEKYIEVVEFRLDALEPEHIKLQFDNLFNGSKQLSDQMNKFLNDNAQLVYKEFRTPFIKSMGSALQKTSNNVLTRVPFDKIFPE